MSIEYDKKRNNKILRDYSMERRREKLGEKWTDAVNDFNELRDEIKKIPKKKRMSLGQAYYESLKLDWTHKDKVFIFFNKPKLKNLSGLMDIMPVFNNDEADNLNLIVRGIRNIIDN